MYIRFIFRRKYMCLYFYAYMFLHTYEGDKHVHVVSSYKVMPLVNDAVPLSPGESLHASFLRPDTDGSCLQGQWNSTRRGTALGN